MAWWLAAVLALCGPGMRGEAAEGEAARWGAFVEPDFPFHSSVLDARGVGGEYGERNLTSRGLILSLGHGFRACFDTELLRVSAIWEGRGVTPVSMAQGSYHVAGRKAPEGEAELPRMDGVPWLITGLHPGWQGAGLISTEDPRDPGPDPRETGRGPLSAENGRFRSVRLTAGGVELEYSVGANRVTERMRAERVNGRVAIRRRIRLDGVRSPLALVVGRPLAREAAGGGIGVVGEVGADVRMEKARDGVLVARIGAVAGPVVLEIRMGPGRDAVGPWPEEEGSGAPGLRWRGEVTTRGVLSEATGAFVVDRVELPWGNPWRRNIRIADLAFDPGTRGRAAAVTFDGDVWWIDGLGDDLGVVTWRRHASGLHEPLGVAIRDGQVHVHDRNGLWRLRDEDGNGEADVHELVSNAFTQTAETREFASGLRGQPDGGWVLAKGGQRGVTEGRHSGMVLRIPPEGGAPGVLGWGFRQPFIGVHPETGQVTASDQQGHYVPTTPLYWLEGNAYHGFLPLILPRERYPAPIAEPMTWIPHAINASGAGQVWLVGARMGPLNGALVHLGYYRPEIFRVLRNESGGRGGAGVVSLTRDLAFPPLAGAVNPADGQLYVAGFQIWGTVAPQVSGIARVRYTGRLTTLPRSVTAFAEGVLLRFDTGLDAHLASDPANYAVERWMYRRTAAYGSPHFRSDGSKGQEAMVPSSAVVSEDRRGVFVGVPGMAPTMQMRVGWGLETSGGEAFAQSAYFTPGDLAPFDPVVAGFGAVKVDLTPRVAAGAGGGAGGGAIGGAGVTVTVPVSAEEGRRLSELMGCVACHSSDGSTLGKVGPSWRGLAGRRREFADGTVQVADREYLRESIREPGRRVVRGYETSDTGMPSYEGVLGEAQIESLVRYVETLR